MMVASLSFPSSILLPFFFDTLLYNRIDVLRFNNRGQLVEDKVKRIHVSLSKYNKQTQKHKTGSTSRSYELSSYESFEPKAKPGQLKLLSKLELLEAMKNVGAVCTIIILTCFFHWIWIWVKYHLLQFFRV